MTTAWRLVKGTLAYYLLALIAAGAYYGFIAQISGFELANQIAEIHLRPMWLVIYAVGAILIPVVVYLNIKEEDNGKD